MTWPSLPSCHLCHLTRRSIFTPRRHLLPCKPTARGKGTTAIEVTVTTITPHGEHSREKARHTENGSRQTHLGSQQKPRHKFHERQPPRHDRPSSILQTPIRTCITSETSIPHITKHRHPTPRRSRLPSPKDRSREAAPNRETAVARKNTRMEHRAHRAHNTQNEPRAATDTNALGPDLIHVVTTPSHRNFICATNAVRFGLPLEIDRTHGQNEPVPTELTDTRET